MKYLCLVYLSQENWSACPDATWFAFAEQLAASGRMLAAEPLHPVGTATTVRVRNGQMSLTDGPFAETKEQLLGFYILDVENLDAALDAAREIAAVNPGGAFEIRPIAVFNPDERPSARTP